MENTRCWQLKKALSLEDIAIRLEPHLRLQSSGLLHHDFTLLDDADWKIWQNDRLLLLQGSGIKMLRLLRMDGSCLAECPARSDSRFWWQLPEGDLAERLKDIISVRALVPKYECNFACESLAILNEDDKTVVRAEFYEISPKRGQSQKFIKILPLKGYERECSQTVETLSELKLTPLIDSGLRGMLQQSGLDVNIPPSKPIFQLQDHELAEIAITRMAEIMLQLVRNQEQGIIDDIDTEFVHQYRVNIRKTRSLVSLFKKTLSVQRYQLLKTELKAIGSQTNELRDLDVFILDHDYYRELLPQHLWPGFDQLFRKIKRRRSTVFEKAAEKLASETYLKQISQLLITLQQPAELITKQSTMKIKDLVSAKVLTQFRRIEANGRMINDETLDSKIHELRIETKKLRYLLELFSELFPPNDVKKLMRHLKVLQDNLGRFNDLSVQQKFLFHCGQIKTISAEQSASINGLAAVLYHQQLHERRLVVTSIDTFLNRSIRNLFQKLYSKKPREGLQE